MRTTGRRLAAIALAIVLAGALWVRFGYEPDPGSHRITVEHVEADGSKDGFVPFVVAVEPVDGVLVGLPAPLRRGWDDAGFGVVRSTPSAEVMTVDGETGPRAFVSWNSTGPGTLRIGVDGTVRETVVVAEAGTGEVVLDFPIRPRAQSSLLGGVFLGWALLATTKLAGPASDVLRRRLAGGTGRRVAAAGGALALVGLIVAVLPIARPAVVRYDLVVQPVGTSQTRGHPRNRVGRRARPSSARPASIGCDATRWRRRRNDRQVKLDWYCARVLLQSSIALT